MQITEPGHGVNQRAKYTPCFAILAGNEGLSADHAFPN